MLSIPIISPIEIILIINKILYHTAAEKMSFYLVTSHLNLFTENIKTRNIEVLGSDCF